MTEKAGLLGVDVSHYQTADGVSLVNYKDLKEKGNIRFLVAKGDKATHLHNIGARDAGMYTSVYHWHDPTLTVQKNLDQIELLDKTYNPDFWSEDIEQWWANWALWWEATLKKISWDKVPRVNPNTLNTHARNVFYGAKEILRKTAVLYTAQWFINGYCPKMAEWVKDELLWLADYSQFGPALKYLNWEEIQKLPEVFTGGARYKPKGVEKELIHQFTDRLVCPGHRGSIDTNIFFGTEEDLAKLAGKQVDEPKPIPIEIPKVKYLYKGKVMAFALYTRKGPSTSYGTSGAVVRNQTVEIWEVKGNWGRISEFDQKWVSLSYIQKIEEGEAVLPPAKTKPLFSGVVTASVLNVRSGVGTNHKVVAAVRKNDPVDVWEVKNNWGRINETEQRWVSLSYVIKK